MQCLLDALACRFTVFRHFSSFGLASPTLSPMGSLLLQDVLTSDKSRCAPEARAKLSKGVVCCASYEERARLYLVSGSPSHESGASGPMATGVFQGSTQCFRACTPITGPVHPQWQ